MNALQNRRILLGVTGGIAAYKSADLTRRLVEAGAQVQVVMTDGAQRFITPLTLQAVSGRAVRTSLWDEAAELGMGHIELARWAELVLVAPATADLIARLAQGRADDLLTTLCLATEAPLMLAPAMNRVMWAHPATEANCRTLRERGAVLIGPAEGELAERERGPGRMLEPLEIRERVLAHFGGGVLAGQRVLITAGPTREPLDPVRYLTNRSSGRMGFAVAAAAAAAGAEVTLVAGPTALATPAGVERIEVETAQQMFDEVAGRAAAADLFIAAAAVADYRPLAAAAQKIKKSSAKGMSLDLARTRDILAETAADHPHLYTVGFAAETEDMEAHARGKLENKGLDLVVGNEVGPEKAFDREDNTLYVCWDGGETRFPTASKTDLARQLIALIGERMQQSEKNAQAAGSDPGSQARH